MFVDLLWNSLNNFIFKISIADTLDTVNYYPNLKISDCQFHDFSILSPPPQKTPKNHTLYFAPVFLETTITQCCRAPRNRKITFTP